MPGSDRLDGLFRELAGATDEVDTVAPSRIRAAQSEAPLCTLAQTRATGQGLCVFEELVRILPVGETARRKNPCRVCHARILAEHFENAPIFWPNCPYVSFQNR